MRERLEQRLQELRAEFQGGEQRLADLEQQAMAMQHTLLRISGAIQVLDEELARIDQQEAGDGPIQAEAMATPTVGSVADNSGPAKRVGG